MNSIKSHNHIGLNYKKSMRRARSFFRKNRLHDALNILVQLRHHGYNEPELIFLTARVYDRLTLLTSEPDYEHMAMETYDEVIRYSDSKKYIQKAVKLQNHFVKRIYSLNENEYRAQTKAEELKNSKTMSPKAWFMLGANFSVRKDPLFVINAYNNAIKLNEKYIAALYRLGYIYQYNMNDRLSALSLYLKLIKIRPWEDTIESESTNVKMIIEACTEISEIYNFEENYRKTISAFDHAFRLFTEYGEICSILYLKRIITNTYRASLKLNNLQALKKHVMTNYGYDLDSILEELSIK